MAINVTTANNQASQLTSYANKLRQTKTQLTSYKTSVSGNWQGTEVPYITAGVEQAVTQIDSVIRQLESLANDIKNTAATIKKEEDAAAAAARAKAQKEQRIREAQMAYNDAVDYLDDLEKTKELLKRNLSNASLTRKMSIIAQLADLDAKIEEAQNRCNACKKTLDAVRR